MGGYFLDKEKRADHQGTMCGSSPPVRTEFGSHGAFGMKCADAKSKKGRSQKKGCFVITSEGEED